MNTRTILPSALLITLCNVASLQGTSGAGQTANKEPGRRSTLSQKQSYPAPAMPMDFGSQWLLQEPTCLWGILLKPGDEIRIREFTSSMRGSDWLRQFCARPAIGTPAEHRRECAGQSIAPDHVSYSIRRAHEYFHVPIAKRRGSRKAVQTPGKERATTIRALLLQISRMHSSAIIAIRQGDYYYFPESGFKQAFIMATYAKGPEVEYGPIEVGTESGEHALHQKPSLSVAKTLFGTKSLCNSFAMVGQICALLRFCLRARRAGLFFALKSSFHPQSVS